MDLKDFPVPRRDLAMIFMPPDYVSETPNLDTLHTIQWLQVPSQQVYEPEMFDMPPDKDKYDLEKYVHKVATKWAEEQAKKALIGVALTKNHIVRVYQPLHVTYEPGSTQFGLVWAFEIYERLRR